jgi:hypothetical protein
MYTKIEERLRINDLAPLSDKISISQIENDIIKHVVSQWKTVCLDALQKIATHTSTILTTESESYFARFAHNKLPNEALYDPVSRL